MEALFDKLDLVVDYVPDKSLAALHPGRTASLVLAGQTIGFVGQVHPEVAKDYGIPETYVAEINLTALQANLQPAQAFVEITKFPAISRDIALLVDQAVSHQAVLDAIQEAGVKRLTSIKLFDVYAGHNIVHGKKSMAYSLTFQNPDDNLTDEEVAKYMEKITKSLTEKVAAEVR